MASRGKIITLNANKLSTPVGNYGSKAEYVCANAEITMGLTSPPNSLEECLQRFAGVSFIAEAVGVTSSSNLFLFPGNSYAPGEFVPPYDLYLGTSGASNECLKVKEDPELGQDFYGCLWGLPEAPFNCSCPNIGDRFEAYLKLRLNIATFWNTPKDAPIKRREFLDSLKYARKFNINIAGDISLRPGNIVEIRTNNLSGYPYDLNASVLNGAYWVLAVKHVFTNSGTHETNITISTILQPNSVTSTSDGDGGGGEPGLPGWNGDLDIPNNPNDYSDPFSPPPGFGGNWS